MWWRFYTELSVKVIDHVRGYLSTARSADMVDFNTPAPSSSHLENMLAQINDELAYVSQQQRYELRTELATLARRQALSEISHDLRTPLNAIIGFTQLMESGIFGPVGNNQYHEYLRHIRESGYELLERIEDLLNSTTPPTDPAHASSALQEVAA